MKHIENFKNSVQDKIMHQKIAFFMRLAIFGLASIIILLYFISPFSKVENYNVKGNYYYTQQEILEIIDLKKNTYLFNVNKKRCEDLLDHHPLFDGNSKIDLTPFSFNLTVKEIAPVYKDETENVHMNNDNLLDKNLLTNELVGEKLNEEIERVPYLISDTLINEGSKKLLYALSLSICGQFQTSIEYIDFRKGKDINSATDDFYIFFKVNDALQDKYFDGNKGYFVLVIDASGIQHCLNVYHSIEILASTIVKYYHDLIEEKNREDTIKSAKLKDEVIFDEQVKTRSFRGIVVIEKGELLIKPVE